MPGENERIICSKSVSLRKVALTLLLVVLTSIVLAACGSDAMPAGTVPNPTAIVATPVQAAQQNAFATSTAGSGSPMSDTTAVATTSVPTSAATAKQGGTLRLALAQEPNGLDPAKTVLGVSNTVNSLLYDRLFYIGKDGLPKPWIAQSWSVSDAGKTLTFKIRPGLKFHDGTALNAKAVKYNFDRIIDPKAASPVKGFIGPLESIETTDELTAVFKFKEPYAAFFTNMSIGYGGIVSPTAVEKDGEQYPHNPVGSGPFKFKEWKTGQSITLERNPDYKSYRDDIENKGAPYIDQVVYTIIPEAATQLAALESGSLDVVDPLQADNADRIGKDSRFNLIRVKGSNGLVFLDFGPKEPFTSLEFRKAVAYAIDRKTIVENATNGYASANTAPMPNGVAGWDGNLNPYPYDPTKARLILKEAGWTTGADGMLTKDDKPISFTLLTYSGDNAIKRATEIIQANLKEIGIDVKVQVQELSTVVALLGKGDFDMTLINVGWPDPSYLSITYKTQNIAFKRVEDKELDNFLTKADTTLEPTQRLELTRNAQKMILERAKVTPVYSPWTLIGAARNVQGYKLDALFLPMYNDVTLS